MYRPVVNQSDAAWHTLINCHEHTLQVNTYYQASSSSKVRSSQSDPHTVMTDSMPSFIFDSSLPSRSYLSVPITRRNTLHYKDASCLEIRKMDIPNGLYLSLLPDIETVRKSLSTVQIYFPIKSDMKCKRRFQNTKTGRRRVVLSQGFRQTGSDGKSGGHEVRRALNLWKTYQHCKQWALLARSVYLTNLSIYCRTKEHCRGCRIVDRYAATVSADVRRVLRR